VNLHLFAKSSFVCVRQEIDVLILPKLHFMQLFSRVSILDSPLFFICCCLQPTSCFYYMLELNIVN
jgi:hypothetical protein